MASKRTWCRVERYSLSLRLSFRILLTCRSYWGLKTVGSTDQIALRSMTTHVCLTLTASAASPEPTTLTQAAQAPETSAWFLSPRRREQAGDLPRCYSNALDAAVGYRAKPSFACPSEPEHEHTNHNKVSIAMLRYHSEHVDRGSAILQPSLRRCQHCKSAGLQPPCHV